MAVNSRGMFNNLQTAIGDKSDHDKSTVND